jgi:signal transduction histidine kinase
MLRSVRTGLRNYGLALLSVLIAFALRFAAVPLVEVDAPFAPFLVGILLTAWYGGFFPGVAASILAASIFAFDLDTSVHSLPAAQRWVRALTFGCGGALISLLVVLLRRLWAQDRRRADDDLKASESRFRELADAMPQIVWTAGPDGRVDYYNRRWTEHTRLSPEETFAVEGWWKLVVHPEDMDGCAARWAEAVRSGQPFQTECRFRTPAGARSTTAEPEVVLHYAPAADWRWFLARAVPVRNERGAVARWYGTCTDIDEQKRATEAVREMSQRKDEFLAMLSHELRNPLAPILNSLQILRLADLGDATVKAARDVIDRQVRHLAGLIEGLLEVFGLVHHKVQLQCEVLDIAALVRRAVDEFRPTITATGIGLDYEAPEAPLWIDADRARMRQVLANLLQNAAKFSNAGDRIDVRVAADPGQGQAAVTVRDTGLGLAPEVMGELFEAFGQGRQPMARSLGGMGLGLALVKGVVELHGGEVHAASAGPGRGSEFGFWVPLAQPPTGPVPAADRHDRGPAETEVHHLRLLIVEDNEDTAATLQLLLKRFGHDVRVAHDGKAALSVAKGWHPHVVLCDLGLPELDGFEVASSLRHDPDTAATRLIAISGYGRDEDRRRTREAGFDLHLTKPVDPLQLRRLLNVLR